MDLSKGMEVTMATSSEQPENTYVIDTESSAEMARLMRQDQLVTQEMGGLFPEGMDFAGVERIVDIACGPGGWVLETAFEHRDIEVVGVDISHKMISYAQAQARAQNLANASFSVMNVLEPLDFPDDSFDIVNVRFIVAFMLPEIWPKFVQECLRITRPGGIVRFTETEWGFSNKLAFARMNELFCKAFAKAGQSFSPNGIHLGILPMLRRFVQEAGCEKVQKMAHVLEFSSGTESHDSFFHNHASGFKLLQPFMLKWNVATQEELNQLYQQTLIDMQSDDYCALWIILTVWGYKPLVAATKS
jgi:ubiquinone/menaquinone biosynthesis C-methylase UbiE